jgi:uncharacterized membrane protein
MQAWTDHRVETIIGTLLRAGVLVAATLTLVGGSIYLARHRHAVEDYRVFHGEPAELRDVGGIIRGSLELHGRGLIQLGLLCLIATPILRVIFSVFAFARQHDRMYVGFTLIVLAVLLYSLLGS